MKKFTVYSLQFSLSSHFTVHGSEHCKQINETVLKTVNGKLLNESWGAK